MKTFYALDLDRTLIDTERLYEVLDIVLGRDTAINLDQLREERMAIETYGESFNTIHRIKQLLVETHSDVNWQHIQRAFIAEARQANMLEPYAAELLTTLDGKSLPYGIITFGYEAWQLTKMEAAGLMNVPRVVTRVKEKGRLLTNWKNTDGSFTIPSVMMCDLKPCAVESIVFLDDKAVSFTDMPIDVRGVFVLSPTRELLPSQRGTVPASVATVIGLDGAIDLLFG